MLFLLSLSPRRPRALLRNVAERNIRATDRMDPSRVNNKTNRKSPTNKLQTVGNVCPMCALMMVFSSCVATSQRRATQNHSKGAKPTSRAVSNFPDRRRLFRHGGRPINCIVASSACLSLRLILSASAQRRPPKHASVATGNRGSCFHPAELQNGRVGLEKVTGALHDAALATS